MTLQEFFTFLSEQPIYVLAYFGLIPLTAILAGLLGRGEGHISPWKYLYSALVYLVCVPGIFAVSLNIYLFLFENQSILQYNILTQFVPIISMIVTLLVIRYNVDLDRIPGFEKLSGLIMIIAVALGLMWIVDRTRLLVFSYLPVTYALGIFIGLLVVLRIGWRRLFSSN
ncbi:MAG: hypothetical protein AAFU60_17070 [Bacteroidota bacterium]